MKATFDKQKLLAALTPAAAISQTKNTLVSVDGLLFECPPDPKFGDIDDSNPDLCRISAFDLEKGPLDTHFSVIVSAPRWNAAWKKKACSSSTP